MAQAQNTPASRSVMRMRDATVFSFHAVKVITAAEGGIVTTQNDAVAQRLRLLRSHGMTRDPG